MKRLKALAVSLMLCMTLAGCGDAGSSAAEPAASTAGTEAASSSDTSAPAEASQADAPASEADSAPAPEEDSSAADETTTASEPEKEEDTSSVAEVSKYAFDPERFSTMTTVDDLVLYLGQPVDTCEFDEDMKKRTGTEKSYTFNLDGFYMFGENYDYPSKVNFGIKDEKCQYFAIDINNQFDSKNPDSYKLWLGNDAKSEIPDIVKHISDVFTSQFGEMEDHTGDNSDYGIFWSWRLGAVSLNWRIDEGKSVNEYYDNLNQCTIAFSYESMFGGALKHTGTNTNTQPRKISDNSVEELKEGEFFCYGKDNTCPNKTYDVFDLYCDSCDPDKNNIEGDQRSYGDKGKVIDNNNDGKIDEDDWEKAWNDFLNDKYKEYGL